MGKIAMATMDKTEYLAYVFVVCVTSHGENSGHVKSQHDPNDLFVQQPKLPEWQVTATEVGILMFTDKCDYPQHIASHASRKTINHASPES